MTETRTEYEPDIRAKQNDTLRTPSVGVMQIDDKAVTAIRYERKETDSQPAYNVSFMMDNKTVVKLKGLNDIDLENAVGDRNAKTIREAGTNKGSLKGSVLANEYGLTPVESNRRIAEKDEQKQPDDPTEKNIVTHEPERLEEIDKDKALAHVARMREAEGQRRLAAEQDQLGLKAEGKRITVENLSEKALEQRDMNKLAERTGAETSYPEQVLSEREKNRQVELMQYLHQQFRVSGAKYHFKDQPQRVAFKDKGERMVSASNDERVAHAMATMAEAKGWKTIRVSGHPDFQREVWMEANLRGIEVRGFKPQEKDLKELDARRDARSKNVVEREANRERKQEPNKSPQRTQAAQEQQQEQSAITKAKQPKESRAKTSVEALRTYSGRVLDHGVSPYNHDPEEKTNYFVKLATDKGEQTVWGVDLKRAMANSKAKNGDVVRLEFQGQKPVTVTALERDNTGKVIGSKVIDTHRNTWDVQKSDRAKVVEAVAAEVLKEKVKDPKQRAAIMKAISERLEQREKAGKVPSVPVYDKQAPSRQKQAERTRAQVDRNAERTR